MDLKEEVQQNNMISNLPLLFANGYPTSLDKISESQLENFIPFMVQCSLGYINLQNNVECSEPEWWPEDLTFTIPFSKPKKFHGNWMEKMREIVIICYQFHRSVFLLRFCNDLAAYEHASLRFINNQNSTTSLFDRRSNKLLVTFRNENMSYDQPQRTRKCLLQQKQKNERHGSRESQQIMVEPAPFDIYLCDNCDAELYSKEAILEHEKTCKVDDDDVILCDTPEPQESNDIKIDNDQYTNDEQRIGFLLNFDLGLRTDKTKNKNKTESSVTKEENSSFMIIDRNMRLPRRNRTVQSLARCPTIPLSSPAGQLLLRTTKANVSTEYLTERLERIERFCHTPLLTKSGVRPKYFERKSNTSLPHCTFKKPVEYSSHIYVFPRRQFSQRRRAENFLILNSQLIKRCRPISVRLKKITDHDIKVKRQPHPPSTKLNIKLTRDTTRNSNWKISSTSSTVAPLTASSSANEIIVDTIDLCSSDEEEQRANTREKHEYTLIEKISPLTVNNNNNNNNNNNSDLVNSANDEKSSKVRLNGLKKRFNNSEVSLIPIRKALNNFTNNNNKNDKLSPPLIRLVSSTNVNDRTENHVNSYYEGNILVSPSTTVTSENGGIALSKPLQPSLYIFSNCANPLAALMTNSNDLISTNGVENGYKTQNQENQLKSKTGITISRTSDSNNHSLSAAPSEWFGSSTSIGSSGNNDIETECTTGNLPLVPNFNTQNRIVSIDLTS